MQSHLCIGVVKPDFGLLLCDFIVVAVLPGSEDLVDRHDSFPEQMPMTVSPLSRNRFLDSIHSVGKNSHPMEHLGKDGIGTFTLRNKDLIRPHEGKSYE